MWCIAVLMLCLTLNEARTLDCRSDPAVLLFQEYLRINTTTNNDLTLAVDFWKKLAAAEDLPVSVHEFHEGYPVVVIRWPGSDSSLSSIMLNSHMDVVPADEEDGWSFPPFSAHIDENGDIYGRGTQDMKSVSIQYFEALRRLKADNVTLIRDVYMTLMPDEETGAEWGMILFLLSEEFANMNVGFALDEGTSYDIPAVPVFYQDKVVWQIEVTCSGVAAHGSTFPKTNDTATGKCKNVMDRLLAFRDEQYEISTTADIDNAGVYTSINLNKLNGGVANNIIPSAVTLTFDIRLCTSLNEEKFEAQLRQWISEAGDNITLSFILKNPQSPATLVGDTNPYWMAISKAADSSNMPILPIVPPGSTDARHVRNAGVPAFGMSPMPNTPLLLHSVDERVNINTFLRGITTYEKIIENLANIPRDEVSTDPSIYLINTNV